MTTTELPPHSRLTMPTKTLLQGAKDTPADQTDLAKALQEYADEYQREQIETARSLAHPIPR